MARFEDENILGLQLDSETVCRNCTTETEEETAELDNIILADEDETDWLFCDRCKNRMQ